MKQKDKKKRKKKKKKIKKKSKKKAKERAKEEKTKGEEVPGPSLEQWQKESVVDSGPGNDALSLLLGPGHTGAVLVPFHGGCLREAGLCTGRSPRFSSLLMHGAHL